MKRRFQSRKIYLFMALVLLFASSLPCLAAPKPDLEKYMVGNYWKQQALKEIIPFWIPTLDKKGGGYFTDIDESGAPTGNPLKYSRMISRLVYGFSTAYLLSGDQKYLPLAKHGLDYLKKYCWDQQYGGWFTELNGRNEPTIQTKELFDETYGNVGPVFYYYVTGDETALSLVQKTHQLMKEKAWDAEYGGYYDRMNRDWSISTDEKSFNAEIDTATAYLIYDYLATKDSNLLSDLKDIGQVAVDHMFDSKSGYIRERFDREWGYIPSYLGSKDQIELGHNLKTAWVLLRTYQLTGEAKFLDYAKKIAEKMLATAWDKENYGWYFNKNAFQPARTPNEKSKCWWTQTEGNFMLLNLYRLTKEERYLDYFRQNSYFWDRYLVDHKDKEVFPYVTENGYALPDLKGNLYKSGYHTMEHALMNYLYLQLYVQQQTADLYFYLSAPAEGAKHYVKIIEDPAVVIQKVELNGKKWEKFDSKQGYIILPKGQGMKVKVTLGMAG